jgi:hypothetical protein
MRQKKQNTEDTVKNVFFTDARNFLKAAKFYRNDLSGKKCASQFSRSIHKKISA